MLRRQFSLSYFLLQNQQSPPHYDLHNAHDVMCTRIFNLIELPSQYNKTGNLCLFI